MDHYSLGFRAFKIGAVRLTDEGFVVDVLSEKAADFEARKLESTRHVGAEIAVMLDGLMGNKCLGDLVMQDGYVLTSRAAGTRPAPYRGHKRNKETICFCARRW